ncbi:hypothetical protein IE53DRAFT_272385 [Violaceomyces palustris]|uniref:Uncharacterized protein n=1 Tax=Violaceomyces palustris TaxID=1673888 RepID=A0ACD0NMU9_9BASI|nr:hypothetical protein IE53DRAFT_272385 [Violaceomyces palustris]
MSLLPVKNLSNSISFYESVLDFTLVSRHENAQAILISGGGRKSDGSGDGPNWNPGGAAICLRSLDHAPAAPPGSGLSRGGSISRNGNLGRSQSIKRPARTPPLLETSPEAAISEPAPDTAAQSPASKQAPDSPSSKTTSEGANLGVVSSSTSGAVVASGCNASSAAASATSAKPKPAAPPPPPPRSGTFTLSGISVLLEHAGPLEGFLTGMEAKMDRWGAGSRNSVASCNDVSRQESRKGDGARVLGGVEKKPWGSQELHVSDPDGHRLIFTAPLESPVYTEFEQPTSYLKL